jgi:protein phosphatase
MRILCWSRTDTGRKRDHNEDNFLVDEEYGLYAVADGMGGHQGGEHASRLALETVREALVEADGDFESMVKNTIEAHTTDVELDTVDESVGLVAKPSSSTNMKNLEAMPSATAFMALCARRASTAVFFAALDEPQLRGMGTTLTAMLYHDGKMHLCHAGDSRAYLFRDGKIQQLTDDHSWINEQVKIGAMTEDEAQSSQYRHIITRSVGFERDVEADAQGIAVEAGDCFVLCSDGMSNYIPNEELGDLIGKTWYRLLPEALVNLANERGGDDNITVVVVYAANDASA